MRRQIDAAGPSAGTETYFLRITLASVAAIPEYLSAVPPWGQLNGHASRWKVVSSAALARRYFYLFYFSAQKYSQVRPRISSHARLVHFHSSPFTAKIIQAEVVQAQVPVVEPCVASKQTLFQFHTTPTPSTSVPGRSPRRESTEISSRSSFILFRRMITIPCVVLT